MRPALLAALVMLVPVALGAPADWEERAPMPLPRTEVVAAVFGSEIGVAGGFMASGSASARADAYSPALDRWRRLPDLPVAVHHAMAAGANGKLYVFGGYHDRGVPLRTAFVLEQGRWRRLPRMPFPRAAAGAAAARGKIVVAGGVSAAGRLARNALSFDLGTRRWTVVPGPKPREHLGVTALGGVVYAVAGRTAGFDTNLVDFESYRPGDRRWTKLPFVPDPRGGTGATALPGLVVSVGGEEPDGTIREVLAYRVAEKRWVQLDDLPTPRHGLGVAAVGGRVFAIGGGPEPGLTVSSANESLAVARAARRSAAALSARAARMLTFRRPDGSRIAFSAKARAWCGAWNTDEPTRALTVAVLEPGGRSFANPYWLLQAVVRDVRPGLAVRYPLPAGTKRPGGAELFVYDSRRRIEASSEEEEARGRISFSKFSCVRGATIRFTVTGVLGSEIGGKPIRAAGTYAGVVGSRPAGWPG
jgi:Kelch motif